MKLSKHLVLFQLIAFIGYGQDKPLTSYVKSQFVNEEGVLQFVKFDETSPLIYENRSDLLKEILKTPENTAFVKVASQTDKIGFLHETYQQYYNNIPVEFGIYKTHLKNEMISAINGEYYEIREINTTPSISAKSAVFIAQQKANNESYDELAYEGSNPTLVIFPKMENLNALSRLAYKLEISVENPLYHADVYVDAHTGEIIFENNKIHHNDVPATGTTLYNGVRSFTAEEYGNDYRLRQATHGNGIQTFNTTSTVQNATDIISTTTEFNSINDAAVQVHWGTERTYEYYMQKHGRNSFDNNGALIKSYITPQAANANAGWNGSILKYSMGNGSTVGPLTSLDVVGHEITHAVIDYTADLIYSYQSGAINESYADIFGEMVENFGQGTNDWICGASCIQNGFRSMSNPKSKGHPDTYLGQYWQTTPGDNYGVHVNSGVHNKWFYLLAVGGTGTNDLGYTYSVTGIGMQKASEIAYRTLAYYLTPWSKFHYTMEASLYAAGQLFGVTSPERMATAEAWKAVGVLLQPTEWVQPTQPLNLVSSSATINNVNTAVLSWNASTDNVGVLGYNIYMNESLIKVTPNLTFTVTQPAMDYNTLYNFKVQAFDAAGNYSAVSNIASVWFDILSPSAPGNLTSSNTTQYTTDLNWTASTDNFGVALYEIYQENTLLATVNSNSTSYAVSGLNPSTTYAYKVKAIDLSGNVSNFSNTVNVTTLAQCATANVTLTITVDWYPEEISWDIRDASNAVVASGGNYPSWPTTPEFSTFTYNYSLASGFYTLNMYDTYGDGIWFPGGYTLQSNVLIASGNETNPSANTVTTPFCVYSMQNFAPSNAIGNGSQTNAKSSGVIYPNPVLDKLYFKNQANENKTFSVVDLTGKMFMEGVLDADNSLDVSKLHTGIYILKMSGNDKTENYKFIKQ